MDKPKIINGITITEPLIIAALDHMDQWIEAKWREEARWQAFIRLLEIGILPPRAYLNVKIPVFDETFKKLSYTHNIQEKHLKPQ